MLGMNLLASNRSMNTVIYCFLSNSVNASLYTSLNLADVRSQSLRQQRYCF